MDRESFVTAAIATIVYEVAGREDGENVAVQG
jgi:hypothetical protein